MSTQKSTTKKKKRKRKKKKKKKKKEKGKRKKADHEAAPLTSDKTGAFWAKKPPPRSRG